MKSRALKMVLAWFTVVSLTATASESSVSGLLDLQKLSQKQLNALYSSLSAGPTPNGGSNGKAILFSGTALTYPAAAFANIIWQGKIFEQHEGESPILYNRVFGFKAIKANVFFGESWFDGQESIIVDYLETSLLVPWVRDEIREISPGLYLGRAYARTLLGPQFVLNFALDFR